MLKVTNYLHKIGQQQQLYIFSGDRGEKNANFSLVSKLGTRVININSHSTPKKNVQLEIVKVS